MRFVDITIRLRDDGGILFSTLGCIEDHYARADRVRQLIYAGLLAERGGLTATANTSGIQSLAGGQSVSSNSVQAQPVPVANDPAYPKSDLESLFGG